MSRPQNPAAVPDPMIIKAFSAIVIAYLLGSFPSAYIAGKLLRGIDIRKIGSRNLGALSVAREVSPWAGLLVLLADMGKGALAVVVARWLELPLPAVLGAGIAAVVGHNWPVFLGFSGGKGAATATGTVIALAPLQGGISLAVMVLALIVTSNGRLAIAVGLGVFPVLVWQMDGPGLLIIYALVLLVFLAIRALPGARETVAEKGEKQSLLFDREYHFWQRRKSK